VTWKAKVAVALAAVGIAFVVGLLAGDALSGALVGVGVAIGSVFRRRQSESGDDDADQDEPKPQPQPPKPVTHEDPLEDLREYLDGANDAAGHGRDFLDHFDRERARIDRDGDGEG
jgi:hypothetical protein